MNGEHSEPGHVAYVRKWLSHNAERLAVAVEAPGPGDETFTGADFVRWLSALLEQHHRICQQEFDRSGGHYHRYTGD
jgi:hypothetical protein